MGKRTQNYAKFSNFAPGIDKTIMDSPIDDYISSHIDAEPENLRRLYRDTHLYQLYPECVQGMFRAAY